MTRKALFLDRDGIVNVDKSYLYRIDDVEFVPGIFDLCRHVQDRGYLIFIVTNQAGIPKGLFTEQDFAHLMEWMLRQFKSRGIEITKVYHCSHHPELTGPCECRKPEPGMYLRAKTEYDLDMQASVSLGDKESDAEAGRRAGVERNYLLRNQLYPISEKKDYHIIEQIDELKQIL